MTRQTTPHTGHRHPQPDASRASQVKAPDTLRPEEKRIEANLIEPRKHVVAALQRNGHSTRSLEIGGTLIAHLTFEAKSAYQQGDTESAFHRQSEAIEVALIIDKGKVPELVVPLKRYLDLTDAEIDTSVISEEVAKKVLTYTSELRRFGQKEGSTFELTRLCARLKKNAESAATEDKHPDAAVQFEMAGHAATALGKTGNQNPITLLTSAIEEYREAGMEIWGRTGNLPEGRELAGRFFTRAKLIAEDPKIRSPLTERLLWPVGHYRKFTKKRDRTRGQSSK
jgi:hypothetical protein